MPDSMTRCDSLRLFLSGATADAGAQADPNLSLGNFRSATEIPGMSFSIAAAVAGVTVGYVSHGNGPGTGTLTAVDATSLSWTPPGGTAGAAVTIANGETKLLEGAAAAGSFVRVSRTSATALTGTATLTVADTFNNLIGFDNVTSAEAGAGDTEYRCLFVRNVSATEISALKIWLATLGTQRVSNTGQLGGSGAGTISTSDSFADWPASGFCRISSSVGVLKEIVYYASRTGTALSVPTGGRALLGTPAATGAGTDFVDATTNLSIASEVPAQQPAGSVQTIANEGAAPTGRTFVTAITPVAGLDLGTLAAGNKVAVWLRRTVVAGQTSAASVLQSVRFSFDAA